MRAKHAAPRLRQLVAVLVLGASPLALAAPPRGPVGRRPAAPAASSSGRAAASAPASGAVTPVASAAPVASGPAPVASAPPVPDAAAGEGEAPVEGTGEGGPGEGMGEAPREGVAAVLWPTATPGGDGEVGVLRVPNSKDGALVDRARELDLVLAEAAQDLGLLLDVGARGPSLPRVVRDAEVIEEAAERKAWVISPRLERDGGELLVRIVAVPPGSKVALVREEKTSAARLAVRVVVMLRDLVQAPRGGAPAAPATTVVVPGETQPERPGRSSGRGVLAASLTVFGGYAGFALHRSGRAQDPRLLFPLMALGAGVGLGAATIIADEWELSAGQAWFLTAGASWPTAAALMLSKGYEVNPASDAHAFALVAGIGGLGLSSIALARRHVGEGGALLAHSGALMGGLLGGLGEMAVRGEHEITPWRGAGYGVAGGWVLGSLAAAWFDPGAGQALTIDLGVGLGALGGAALASPLLLNDPGAAKQRVWVGATALGAVAGGVVGGVLGRPVKKAKRVVGWLPAPGVVATVPGVGGRERPVMGLTWNGVW